MKIPRKIPIIPKYLILNSQPLIFTSWIVIAFVSLLVLLGLHKSILTEITTILGILAVSLFVFFFIGLYRGIVLEGEEPHVLDNIKSSMEKVEVSDPSTFFNVDYKWVFSSELALIAIIAIIVWIFGYLLFFGLYFLILLLMALYLVFYLAYGMVFRHSQDTKGDVIKSLTHSVMYTILYTGVFFILIQVIKVFLH